MNRPQLLDRGLVAGPNHIPSHRPLLGCLLDYPRADRVPPLDVVVVPTSRPFSVTRDALSLAIDIVDKLGGRLLVLCSGEAREAEFPVELLAGRAVRVAVLRLPDHLPFPALETSEHPLARNRWTVDRDVAAKRNLAIWLAAAARWRYVLFLDDDVRPVDRRRLGGRQHPVLGVGSVTAALAVLAADAGPVAAGWIMTQFWDNSVVCHARRLGGLPQDSFIGGGALLIKLTPRTPFFPDIYNEDWLFLYQLMRTAAGPPALVLAGIGGQKPYQPFRPVRAASEELPDLLAEGLFAALQRGVVRSDRLVRSREFWAEQIRRRQSMVRQVRRMVIRTGTLHRLRKARTSFRRARIGPSRWVPTIWAAMIRRKRAWDALSEALDVHHDVSGLVIDLPGEIIRYLHAWSADLRRWRKCIRTARADDAVLMLAGCSTIFGSRDAWDYLGVVHDKDGTERPMSGRRLLVLWH